ncbi:MAG: VOC family protein [Flavobacteriaceae bacterium]
MTINPYLTFNGNCEEAFNFYKSVFGGDFSYIGKFKDIPQEEGQPPMPEAVANRIMHVSLPISKETVLMGSDNSPEHGEVAFGQNINISISPDSRNEADRIFNALAKAGTITMPIADMFWGDYFGMVTDKFGVMWMVNFNAANVG